MSAALAVTMVLAGALAAPAAGWDLTNRILRLDPGRGRQVLISLAEALVGLGTGALALLLATRFAEAHTAGIVAAATAGIGIGVRRQVKALSRARDRVTNPAEAQVVDALRSVVAYGAASRLVGVVAVLIGILVAFYGPQ